MCKESLNGGFFLIHESVELRYIQGLIIIIITLSLSLSLSLLNIHQKQKHKNWKTSRLLHNRDVRWVPSKIVPSMFSCHFLTRECCSPSAAHKFPENITISRLLHALSPSTFLQTQHRPHDWSELHFVKVCWRRESVPGAPHCGKGP